jgi:hypothetical protein
MKSVERCDCQSLIKKESQQRQSNNFDIRESDSNKATDVPKSNEVVRYDKSFMAKFIQLTDESKVFYTTLKNYILSYKKTRSCVSWKYDSIHLGKKPIAKFAIRGRTLCLYMALNPDDYTNSKYKVERTNSKKFEDVPCLYRIKNQRRVAYAKELISVLAEGYCAERGEIPEINYFLPYEHTAPLVGNELVRKYYVQESEDDFLHKKDQADII